MTSFTKLTFLSKRDPGESHFAFGKIPVSCSTGTSATLMVWAQITWCDLDDCRKTLSVLPYPAVKLYSLTSEPRLKKNL